MIHGKGTDSPAEIRVGIVGAGKISQVHARVLRSIPGVTVSAVCDVDGQRAEALRARWNFPQAFDSLPQMLRRCKLDAVQILLPPALHAAAALESMEAGCDVLIEKPVAVTLAECRSLRNSASRLGRIVGVNHNGVYFPVLVRLFDLVRSRRLGAVQHVSVCFKQPLRQLKDGMHDQWLFRDPGNLILELGPHPLSWIHRLLGNVQTASVLPSGKATLTTGAAFFHDWQIGMLCERGSAHLFLSVGDRFPEVSVTVYGEDATAVADVKAATLTVTEKSRFMMPAVDHLVAAVRNSVRLMGNCAANLKDFALGILKPHPLADHYFSSMLTSVTGFYEAVQRRGPAPVDLEQGTNVVSACQQIIRAGRAVSTDSQVEEHELASIR